MAGLKLGFELEDASAGGALQDGGGEKAWGHAAAQGTDKNRPNPTSPSGANANAALTELARHQLKNHFDKFKTFVKQGTLPGQKINQSQKLEFIYGAQTIQSPGSQH